MKTKLLLKKTLIMTVAIVSMCASQNLSAMTTTLRTAGTASKNLYKTTSKRAYHADLGVGPNATKDEIENAFRKLAFKTHPNYNKSPHANEQMTKLNDVIAAARKNNYASAEELAEKNKYNQSSYSQKQYDPAEWAKEEAKWRKDESAMAGSIIAPIIAPPFMYYIYNKPKAENNIDNGKIIPTPQASNTDQQAPTISEPIIQVNQQAPNVWTKMAENSAELVNQNPAITAIAAAALAATAAFYTYKYATTPAAAEQQEFIDKESENTKTTTAEEDENLASIQEELKDAKKASSWSSRWKW
jgi:hypothetical protein